MSDHVISVTLVGNAAPLVSSLSQASAAIGGFMSTASAMGGSASGMASGMNTAAGAAGQLNSQISRVNAAGRSFVQIQQAMANASGVLGKSVAAVGAFASQTAAIFLRWMAPYQAIRLIESGIKFAVNTFMDFDKQMVESTAIMGNMSEMMRKDLAGAAIEVSKTTKYSAAEAASGIYFLASAGFDAKASIEALPVVARFAQAGVLELSKASEYLMDVTAAAGKVARDSIGNIVPEKTAENMKEMSDILVRAAVDSNATVGQMAEAFTGRAAGMFRALGKDVKEEASVLEAFASVGIKGSQASTQLYMAMRDLQKAAVQNSGEFDRLGIHVYDSNGKMNNFADIMNDLKKATKGMSDEQLKATFQLLGFQDRSSTAILSVMDLGNQMKVYQAKLEQAGGATQDVADRQMQALGAQIDLLQHKFGDWAIDVGGNIRKVVAEIGSALTPLAHTFGETIGKMLEIGSQIWDIFGPIITFIPKLGFGALVTSINFLLEAFNKLQPIVIFITSKIVLGFANWVIQSQLVQGAMSGLVTAGLTVGGMLENLRNSAKGMFAAMMEAFSAEGILGGLRAIGRAILQAITNWLGYKKVFTTSQQEMAAASAAASDEIVASQEKTTLAAKNGSAALLTAVLLVYQEIQNTAAEARKSVENIGKGLDETKFSEYSKRYKLLADDLETTRAEFNKETGGLDGQIIAAPSWDNFGKSVGALKGTLHQLFDLLPGGSNSMSDLSARLDTLTEEGKKHWETINNVNNLYKTWGKQAGYTQQQIFEAANKIGVDLTKAFDATPEGMARYIKVMQQLRPVIEENKAQLAIWMDTQDNLGAHDEATTTIMIDNAKKLQADVGNAWESIADPVRRYNELIGNTVGLTDLFSESITRLKAQQKTSEDVMATAAEEASQSRLAAIEEQKQAEIDALNNSTSGNKNQAAIDQREQNQEIARQQREQNQALTIGARESQQTITKTSTGKTKAIKNSAIDQKQAISDSATDQKQATADAAQEEKDANADATRQYTSQMQADTTARKNQIEKKYKALETQERNSQKEFKDKQQAEQNDPNHPIKFGMDKIFEDMTGQVDKAEKYRIQLNKLASNPNASVDLLKMFENMKPDEGMQILTDFNSHLEDNVKKFEDLNERLKKSQMPSAQEMLAPLKKANDDMMNLQKNFGILSKAGIDPSTLSLMISKFKDKSPEIFQGLVDQLNTAGLAAVQQVTDGFKAFGQKSFEQVGHDLEASAKYVKGVQEVQSGSIAQGSKDIQDAMSQISPENLMASLKAMGIPETEAASMVAVAQSIFDQNQGEMKKKVDELVTYMQSKLGISTPTPGVDAFRKLHPEFQGPIGEDEAKKAIIKEALEKGHGILPNEISFEKAKEFLKLANGGILNAYANGGMENHVAQFAMGGTTRMWGEPETGGEAYIPLADSKRYRSMGVLGSVADMFGYMLHPKGTYSGMPTANESVPMVSSNHVTNNNFNGMPVERAILVSERRQSRKLTGRQR